MLPKRHRCALLGVFSISAVLTAVLYAAGSAIRPVQLVVDLNTRPVSRDSDPQFALCDVGPYKLLFADDKVHGRELWRTDGTAAGTILLADTEPDPRVGATLLCIGKSSSGVLYYEGRTEATGIELWRTDGTPAGTHVVRDINPGTGHGFVGAVGFVGTELVFIASPTADSRQVWITDGTDPGTRLIEDLSPTPGDPAPGIGLGDIGFGTTGFFGTVTPDGADLWVTDGTAAGTQPVHHFDTPQGPPFGFLSVGPRIVFWMTDATLGQQIWGTDGTAAGTIPVTNFSPADVSGINTLLPLGANRAVLTVSSLTGESALWGTDGTPAGTQRIDGPNDDLELNAVVFRILPGRLIFNASNPTSGDELWASDGTDAGTVLLTDIEPGPDNISVDLDFASAAICGARTARRTERCRWRRPVGALYSDVARSAS